MQESGHGIVTDRGLAYVREREKERGMLSIPPNLISQHNLYFSLSLLSTSITAREMLSFLKEGNDLVDRIRSLTFHLDRSRYSSFGMA